ncbi:MAG: anaerobic ribonucleoside-triphosphate reductase activating protein [Clostridia bacterium]|nr:anaerobic ribonucleoside-triphosphate reductase activating protein [Clostridia bacterium]
MIIGGFQKMTMLDYPGKVACTVFTYGCNLRCPFCHNASLVIDEAQLFSEEEILSYIEKRKKILDGVCISGGEPLMQKDIFDFMRKIKSMGLLVKLDTNGSYPEKLKEAIELGLVDYVAMDIKNSKEKYAITTGKKSIDISAFEKSVELLLCGRVEYEFRTTVVKQHHELEDIKSIGKWIKGAEKYFLQDFVDSGNLIENGLCGHEKNTLEAFKQAVFDDVKHVSIRGT